MFLRSLNTRIAALFSGVFIVASTILFAVFYLFQYNTLVQEDHRNLEARTIEFWAVYQTGGAVAVQRELNIEAFLTDYDPFLLRIASWRNVTLALYYPSAWNIYRIDGLAEGNLQSVEGIIRVPAIEGKAYLEVASVILPDRNILQIAMSSAKRQTLLGRFRVLYFMALLPILAFSFTGGIFFSTRTLKPINRLIDLTRSIIETGRMSERLPLGGRGDELDELTDLFNRMLKRIETLIDGMRTSLDNVAHDLRTPLTRLRHKIETAAADGNSNGGDALAAALEEAERIQSMLRTIMDISEAETGVMDLSRSTVDLSEIVGDLTDFYGYLADDKNLVVRSRLQHNVKVSIDVNRFRQVITNVLDNAVKYTPSGGSIDVSVYSKGHRAVLEVSDTGIGIPEEDIPHIWERLFRGDRSRTAPGLGLGLGLVKAIVHAHEGSVEVRSVPGEGSSFTIELPM